MACEIMLHGGNTRRNARPLCLARAFTEIMEHQYKSGPGRRGILPPAATRAAARRPEGHPAELSVARRKRAPDSPAERARIGGLLLALLHCFGCAFCY